MPDDYGTPTSRPSAPQGSDEPSRQTGKGPPPGDEDEDEGGLREYLNMFDKRGLISSAIKRGEKDFESHGTLAQASVLEASREVLYDILKEQRMHNKGGWLRGWYFPDTWADASVERDEVDLNVDEQKSVAKFRGLNTRERTVILDHDGNTLLQSIGRVIPGSKGSRPGWDRVWLLPEEALYLIERGSIDIWYPDRAALADIYPENSTKSKRGEMDDYDKGYPLSLEAAYSLFLGEDGERGKITLEKYQVYANLKRMGYHVLRAPQRYKPPHPPPSEAPPRRTLWQWMVSLFSSKQPSKPAAHMPPAMGPLVRPGLYRGYGPIFEQIALMPRHKPSQARAAKEPEDPFRVFYFVWKSGGETFPKANPPKPDFYMAIVDARKNGLPTLEQIDGMHNQVPWDPPAQQGHVYAKLKKGYRSVIVAVVEQGLVNYYTFSEGGFGMEPVYVGIDSRRDQKTSKRGGHRGRGRKR